MGEVETENDNDRSRRARASCAAVGVDAADELPPKPTPTGDAIAWSPSTSSMRSSFSMPLLLRATLPMLLASLARGMLRRGDIDMRPSSPSRGRRPRRDCDGRRPAGPRGERFTARGESIWTFRGEETLEAGTAGLAVLLRVPERARCTVGGVRSCFREDDATEVTAQRSPLTKGLVGADDATFTVGKSDSSSEMPTRGGREPKAPPLFAGPGSEARCDDVDDACEICDEERGLSPTLTPWEWPEAREPRGDEVLSEVASVSRLSVSSASNAEKVSPWLYKNIHTERRHMGIHNISFIRVQSGRALNS